MTRPRIDVNAHVTAIARAMLDGVEFNRKFMSPEMTAWITGSNYRRARDHVIKMMPEPGTARHAFRCRLDSRFREIAGVEDQNSVDPDRLRLMAVDARLIDRVARHPELAAAIDLDRLTLWRRWHPCSLEGWLRVQLAIYR